MKRHKLFAVLLAAGLVLRVLVTVAYRPALFYIDSVGSYLNALPSLYPGTSGDPIGYVVLLLWPVLTVGNLTTVTVVQHLLGLGMAVVTYAVLVRWGVRTWLAALATVPVLLDAYQVQLEHNIMSDTLFQSLLVAGFATLAWSRKPGWRTVGAAGALLGLAATVRVVGQPVVLPAVLYAAFLTGAWRRRLALTIATVAGFALPVLIYCGYNEIRTHHFTLSRAGSEALYGRVATFANCDGASLPAYERQLCPTEPRALRPGPDFWAHDITSPRSTIVDLPEGVSRNEALMDFSLRIIRHQPLQFVGSVASDAAKALSWNRPDYSNVEAPTERWRFQTSFPEYPPGVSVEAIALLGQRYGGGAPVVVVPVAAFLRAYQLKVGYTPGPLLGLAALLALLAAAGLGRARRSPARLPCLLYLTGGLVVLGAADLFEFSWRYQLPGLVLLPAAGALAITALTRARPPAPEFPEPADADALAEFGQRYGEPDFPPVVVVIAAYNEAGALGAVLDAVPANCAGLDLATLVVVDGSTDATAEVARGHGAYTCAVPVNRGQGAALRLGYHLARTRGADIIVTTDADGQYDLAELPVLLEPLLSGAADFVTGSRRLGSNQATDPVRRLGVRVFARLVSVLTGQRITDTSFGFRAMRAEVTAAVTLAQPQYQSSELLVGALSRGFRVVERPMTMRPRSRGKSKKGNNFVYGLRYARVVLTTWARERRARSAAGRQRGPAVRT
jgi:hypothetical protein